MDLPKAAHFRVLLNGIELPLKEKLAIELAWNVAFAVQEKVKDMLLLTKADYQHIANVLSQFNEQNKARNIVVELIEPYREVKENEHPAA